MTRFNSDERAIIERGKLVIVTGGGSRHLIGARQARKDIKRIEASSQPLAHSTRARLAVLKSGVALWDARHR
jgi:hypothetical protein